MISLTMRKQWLRVILDARETELLGRALDFYYQECYKEVWQPWESILNPIFEDVRSAVEKREKRSELVLWGPDAATLLTLFDQAPGFVEEDQREGNELINGLREAIQSESGLTTREGISVRKELA